MNSILITALFVYLMALNVASLQGASTDVDHSLKTSEVERRSSPMKFQAGLTWANRAWGRGKATDSIKDKKVVIVDMFDATDAEISNYKTEHNLIVICYVSVGTVESWRSDYKDNKSAWDAVKAKNHGWAGETWIDIVNKLPEIKNLMRKRFKLAKEKGCDAIEPDNVDCYQQNKGKHCINGVGESEVRNKQISYDKWMANTVHDLGMGIGLKNSLDLIPDLLSYYDFAVNEECVEFEECYYYESFHKANKAIFGTEYGEGLSKIRKEAKKYGMKTKNEMQGKWKNIW